MQLPKNYEFAVQFARFANDHGVNLDNLPTLAEICVLRTRISKAICAQPASEKKVDAMREKLEALAAPLGFRIQYDCHLPSLMVSNNEKWTQVFPPSPE